MHKGFVIVAMENTSKGCKTARTEPPSNSRGLVTVSSTKSQSSICRINCAQFSSLGVGGTRCDGIKCFFFFVLNNNVPCQPWYYRLVAPSLQAVTLHNWRGRCQGPPSRQHIPVTLTLDRERLSVGSSLALCTFRSYRRCGRRKEVYPRDIARLV